MLFWEDDDRSHASDGGPGGAAPDAAGLVFVYGTLKRDGPLHEMLGSGAGTAYVDADRVVGFTLQPHRGGHFPAAVPSTVPGAEIRGEVYRLDECTLAILDRIEGANRPEGARMYRRTTATTVAGRTVWLYVWAAADGCGYLAPYVGASWDNAARVVRP